MRRSCAACMVLILLASCSTAAHAGSLLYRLTPLGNLGGTLGDIPLSMNDRGQVVGHAYSTQGNFRPVLWQQDGQTQDLGTLYGDSDGQARGINNSCQVVGSSSQSGQAVLWSSGSTHSLGFSGSAAAINDLGQMVINSGGQVLKYSGITTQNLGVGYGQAINARGWVVGESIGAQGSTHAFLWQEGRSIDLGALGGTLSYARDINDSGLVVGVAQDAQENYRGFFWKGGGVQSLGTLGGLESQAESVNNLGQVVGFARDAAGRARAFAWQEDAGMFDLNTCLDQSGSGWSLTSATAINNLGQIAGYGWNAATGRQGVFLLTPVPEPSSLLALLGGITSIGGMAWRRRR